MPFLDGDFVEVRVIGIAEGQAIMNRFHYQIDNISPEDEPNETAVLEAFKIPWRQDVLPLLTDNYHVVEYQAHKVVEAVVLEGDINLNPQLVYGASVAQGGDADDDKGGLAVATNAPFPTYVAASVRKICGETKSTEVGNPPVNKRLKGGCRIGPLPESATEAATPNILIAATRASLLDAFVDIEVDGSLIQPAFLGPPNVIMHMVVIGLYFGNNIPWPQLPDEGDPANRGRTFLYAPVTSAVVSEYISSQVSRKQRFTLG